MSRFRDDGSDAFAGARRGHRQQMGQAVIAQQLLFWIAADQQAGIGAGGAAVSLSVAKRAEPWVSPSMSPKWIIRDW